jgi:hypothetical protein
MNKNEEINKTSFPGSDESPVEKFSVGTKLFQSMADDHPFGCPVYVLDGKLQRGARVNKWTSRARSVVYLGHSY